MRPALRRPLRIAVAGVAVVGAIGLLPSTRAVAATPSGVGGSLDNPVTLRAEAATLTTELAARSASLGQLSERYDAAGIRLAALQAQAAAMGRTLAVTHRRLAGTIAVLRTQAMAGYVSGEQTPLIGGPGQPGWDPSLTLGYIEATADLEHRAMAAFAVLGHAHTADEAALEARRNAARTGLVALAAAETAARRAQAAEAATLAQVTGRLGVLVTADERRRQAAEVAAFLRATPANAATSAPPATTVPASTTLPTTSASTAATTDASPPTSPATMPATTMPAATGSSSGPVSTRRPTTARSTTTVDTAPPTPPVGTPPTAPSIAPSTVPARGHVRSTTTTTTTAPTTTIVAALPAPPGGAGSAIAYAQAQLGKPYQWGGAGPADFDCSGLVMRAWEAGGVGFAHLAQSQYDVTARVPVADLQPGDIVFFGAPGNVYHDGLYVGGGQMIDAPSTGQVVRIESIYWPSLLGGGRVGG